MSDANRLKADEWFCLVSKRKKERRMVLNPSVDREFILPKSADWRKRDW